MPGSFNAAICLFFRDALLLAPSKVKEFAGNAQVMFWDAVWLTFFSRSRGRLALRPCGAQDREQPE
jgi:hypothetical protein